MKETKFTKFINKKHLETQLLFDKKMTVGEFAEYCGVSQSIMSMWMNGDREPSEANTEKLAALFGIEIYDALEKPRPDEDWLWFINNWESLPEHIRKGMRALREEAQRYNTTGTENAERVSKKRRT